jgi:hypothetical protein
MQTYRVGFFGWALLTAACGSDIIELDGSGGDGGSSSNIGATTSAGGSTSSSQSASQGSGAGASTSSGTGASSSTAAQSGTGTGPGSTTTVSGAGGATSTNSGSTSTGEPTCSDNGDACSACASTSCPSEWCACAANAECPPLITCWDGCETEECFQDCMTAHTSGISDAANVQSCASSVCSACQAGWEPLDPCSACMFESCEQPTNACLAVSVCSDLWACLGECPPLGLTCQQECYEVFGEGTALLQDLLTCVQNECPGC